jgi:hypothetical protein
MMPQIVPTIDEYIATQRKETTIWMVFNTVYNDVHAFNKKDSVAFNSYLNEEYTNKEAQQEFLTFMKENFPQTKLVKVFDLVSAGHLIYPYLGSYAIDTNIGSEAYNALAQKYGDPFKDATTNKSVLWVMKYKDACEMYNERKEMIDAEFGE